MDEQFSYHCGMLMRYVTNYVSKFKDSRSSASLFCTTLVPARAAYRHLRDMKPCEPEMIMTLSSIKAAWCSISTKTYVPPRPRNAGTIQLFLNITHEMKKKMLLSSNFFVCMTRLKTMHLFTKGRSVWSVLNMCHISIVIFSFNLLL